jgi:DNA modification methylase
MIYNEDFLTGIFAHDIKNVKLVVTSPPYFDARNYGGKTAFMAQADWLGFCVRAIQKLTECLTEDGAIWWNTGCGYRDHRQMTIIYEMIMILETWNKIYLIDDIPWIKKSSPPKNINNRPYPGWEHNFIFSPRPELVKFQRDNVRRPYAEGTVNRMKYATSQLSADLDGEYLQRKMVTPNAGGASPPNYLVLPQDTTARPHPATMLPELANWAIRAYSSPGDLILDPMSGIGTTWVEATKLKRKFVGFELEQNYIDIANLSMKRLERGDDPYRGLTKEWRQI